MASKDSFMFTVGKVDAGMAILIGERAHLIEFPSVLLPSGCTSGSIVNIAVHRNLSEEQKQKTEFWDLQEKILSTFGIEMPEAPKLLLRNVTQTSVTLEWPALKLATAKLRSLDIYRNGQRLATIPSPTTNTSTKLSGLQLDSEYTFQLILRTTAGTYPSSILKARTHKITDTSGISVCFGNVTDKLALEHAKIALKEMGAKWSDTIQIDTSHFVCNTPAATGASDSSSPGPQYQRALQLSIPVVQPQWILACHSEKKMVPIANYYLGVTPAAPINSAPFTRPASMSNVSIPMPHSPTKPNSEFSSKNPNRASLPITPSSPRHGPKSPPLSPFLNQSQSSTPEPPRAPSPESRARASPDVEEASPPPSPPLLQEMDQKSASAIQKGTMNKGFKFPPPANEIPPRLVIAPSETPVSIPEPTPPPQEDKEKEDIPDDGDVGETVEVDLS